LDPLQNQLEVLPGVGKEGAAGLVVPLTQNVSEPKEVVAEE
jgi:hypothetical protein